MGQKEAPRLLRRCLERYAFEIVGHVRQQMQHLGHVRQVFALVEVLEQLDQGRDLIEIDEISQRQSHALEEVGA